MAKDLPQGLQLPFVYRAFFLFIEPISALNGAIAAYLDPAWYLRLTDPSSSYNLKGAQEPERVVSIALAQLANLYALFAINEALVLRSSSDIRVWKTLLFGLLIADLGHLYTVMPLGLDVYWKFWEWNVMAFGNVGFVYVGALLRLTFLLRFDHRQPVPVSRKGS